MKRSWILKYGNEADKSQLPEATKRNQSHTGQQRKRRRKNTPPGLARRSRAEQDGAGDFLSEMLRAAAPRREAMIPGQVAELEEQGRLTRQRLLGRAESGLGNDDGNALAWYSSAACRSC